MEKKTKEKDFEGLVNSNGKNVAFIFLGVGLAIFVLNIASFLLPYVVDYNYINFDISTFGAVIIILVSTYMITEGRKTLKNN
jgi:predicted tellurium resistance membrane protein TerC